MYRSSHASTGPAWYLPRGCDYSHVSIRIIRRWNLLTSAFSVHTTVTKCPVTKTVTTEKTTSVEVYQSDSTVYETVTSTICTKCYGPSPAPVASVPAGPSPSGNTEAGVGVISGGPGSPTSFAVVTMTIVPLSNSPSVAPLDTSLPSPQPAPPSETPVDSGYSPVVKGNSKGSPEVSAPPNPVSSTGPTGPTIEAFTGSASRTGAGVLGCLVIALMVALMS